MSQPVSQSVQLPTEVISYDPVKQKIVRPKENSLSLLGYKGANFFDVSYVINKDLIRSWVESYDKE